MNAIIENTTKFLVSALLATFATVLFGGMVAVSAGNAPATAVTQHSQTLQAHTLAAKHCLPA
ncbi:MAG TPA: hypothetical protein VF931_09705 [Steroidobacteraceae bacterium]